MTVKPASPGKKHYHHGSLRDAILASSTRILARDGIAGLTLRAAAREAGVSHAAPKNHFGDLTGLLSELAASGMVQLRAEMLAASTQCIAPAARLSAIGASYVRFAVANPAFFLLMFRRERLDMNRPGLCEAAAALLRVLADATRKGEQVETGGAIDEAQALDMIAAWSQVHGLAMLLIDGRLQPIFDRLPAGIDETDLLRRLLGESDIQA